MRRDKDDYFGFYDIKLPWDSWVLIALCIIMAGAIIWSGYSLWPIFVEHVL